MLNDTVVVTYSPAVLNLQEVERFCHWLRVFQAYAIVHTAFFRGAMAVGAFYVADERTALGPAISDAAAWFESADWIGVHATPRATMFIQALLDARPPGSNDMTHVYWTTPCRLRTPRG